VKLNLVSYLVKPIKMDELKNTIMQAIDEVTANRKTVLYDKYYWDSDLDTLY